MSHRIRRPAARATTLAGVLVLASAASALAGGWANAVMDAPPAEPPTAGEPLTIGFTLLQHGETPVESGPTSLVLRARDGTQISAIARRDGPAGHWVATVTLPAPGTWTPEVRHDLAIRMEGAQPLSVQSGNGAAATASGGASSASLAAALIGALGLVVLAGGVLLLSRGREGELPAGT